MAQHDVYADGELTENELELLKQQRIDERQDNQKVMAWVALGSVIAYTIGLFMPFLPDSRAEILTEIAPLFYVAQAGIIGAYMGSEAMVNRSRNQSTQQVATNASTPRVGR